jgi:hypothetical protein
MKRIIVGVLLASTIGVLAAACGDDSSGGSWGYGYGGGGGACSSYGSCGTCTPVVGCGWCFSQGGGGGYCASDPSECSAGSSRWTWDPSGCEDIATPSVNPLLDAGSGSDVSSTDAAATDATSASDTTSAGDTATDSAAASGDGAGQSDSAAAEQ